MMSRLDWKCVSLYGLVAVPLLLGMCMFALAISVVADLGHTDHDGWRVAEQILQPTTKLRQASRVMTAFTGLFFLVSLCMTLQAFYYLRRASLEGDEGADQVSEYDRGACHIGMRVYWMGYSLVILLAFLGCVASGVHATMFRTTYLENPASLQDNLSQIFSSVHATNETADNPITTHNMLLVDEIQVYMECCGVHGPRDYIPVSNRTSYNTDLPQSCCNHATRCLLGARSRDYDSPARLFMIGCLESLSDKLRTQTIYVTTISYVTSSFSIMYIIVVNLVYGCLHLLQIPDVDESRI